MMADQPSTVLVTGATGFLGKAVLDAFREQTSVRIIAACRDRRRMADGFAGEVREGDLRDSSYLERLVKDVDVICHTGTWAAMWGHRQLELHNFYHPTLALMDAAINAGVRRFLMTSTVVIAQKQTIATRYDDFSPTRKTGFWPHLDYLIDIDRRMQSTADGGMQMISMRLGHFVGAGNTLGLVPVLVPRLFTRLVPWLAAGKSRMPLVTGSDLGDAYLKASLAQTLNNYESFNICGSEFPSAREVIRYIADKTGAPTPWFSVPYPMGYAFAFAMEKLFPIVPGKAPFLTRSIVHLAEDWRCNTDYACKKLGYTPQKDWRTAMDEALADLATQDYPWPRLAQRT
jgi:nucleoside-diphosphate-sugar epimerase